MLGQPLTLLNRDAPRLATLLMGTTWNLLFLSLSLQSLWSSLVKNPCSYYPNTTLSCFLCGL